MEDYVEEAQEVSLDDDLRESYDKEWALKDLGLQLGKKEGREEGREEGIEEANKTAAINLMKNEADLELISKSLGYSIEELEELKKEYL